MARRLVTAEVECVVLAGYDRILGDAFWDVLGDVPVINIHPSLLPAFGGLNRLKVHEAVLAAGVAETGCTVHRAHRGMLDEGETIVQRRVPVMPVDDPETLDAPVLPAEHSAPLHTTHQFASSPSQPSLLSIC